MKKNNYFILTLSLIGLLSASCQKESPLDPPQDNRSSYFLPAPAATDEESILRKTFYTQEHSYLLFNDTLRHELLGYDYNGDKQYFTETVNIGYSLPTPAGGGKLYTHALFESIQQKKAAIDFMKTYVLSHLAPELRPFSWLLTQSTSTVDVFGIPFYPLAVANQRCIAVSLGDILQLSDVDKATLANTILSTTLSSALATRPTDLNKFYAFSENEYGGRFELESYTPEANMEALKQRGFIVQNWIIEEFWLDYGVIPSKEKDVESYINLIFEYTDAEVMTTYTDYPIVLNKYQVLKSLIYELGYKN